METALQVQPTDISQQIIDRFEHLQEDLAVMDTVLTFFLDTQSFHTMGNVQDGFIIVHYIFNIMEGLCLQTKISYIYFLALIALATIFQN